MRPLLDSALPQAVTAVPSQLPGHFEAAASCRDAIQHPSIGAIQQPRRRPNAKVRAAGRFVWPVCAPREDEVRGLRGYRTSRLPAADRSLRLLLPDRSFAWVGGGLRW